jgi:eukaryotic-like serine/threonine-protein kinase
MLGQRFSHYVIEQKLGEGGMGVVYRARDEKLQRDVALKFLGTLPSGSSASHERALQEARAISALNHPNICTVYEVGELDGCPFIAMEFVEGRSLTLEIPSVGLSLDQVERYGMQLADALAHAHSRGVLHRDLKTANVIITPSGRLKVLDFGISRRLEAGKVSSDGTTVMDQSWESQHTFTGTLPYVAPEILKGQEADVRSDIWSLGVLLYETAAGHRPFRGITAFELSAAILHERPPQINPPLPPVLQSVIDKCLDKDPGHRYQSAAEVRAALEAVSTASHTHDFVRTPTPQPRKGPFSLRNILTLGLILGLVAGLVYLLNSNSRHKRGLALPGAIQSAAVLPLENLSGDPSQEYFADGMTDALITQLSQIRKLRVISRTSVMQYKHTQKPLDQIAQELNVDAIVEGSVVRSGDRVRISAKLFQTNIEGALWAGNFERNFTDVLGLQSDVATSIARQIQVQLSSAEQSQLARTRSVVPEAYEAYLKGKYELEKRTPDSFQNAATYFKQAIEKDGTFAAAYAGLADTYQLMFTGELAPAENLVPQAKAAAEKALELDDRLAEAHCALGAIRFWHLENAEIEPEFQKAIGLDPGYAQAIHWYALYLGAAGQREESIREIKLAREIDPKSLIINANVGFLYYLAGDYDRAVEAEKNTIQMDPSFVSAHAYLGQAYVEKKQYREAIDEFRNALGLSPGDISAQADLARALAISGQRPEAEDMLRGMQDSQRGKYVSPYDFAVVFSGFQNVEQTLDSLEKSLVKRNARLVNLAVHPQFAFLRKERRFQNIVEKIWGHKLIVAAKRS